jgi:Arc/MetJ-type ribon-helix-helix transcriptional regulator
VKIITINLSEPHVKALQILQDLGIYPSRSEAIRVAIRDFLRNELGFAQKFDDIESQPVNHERIAACSTQSEDKKKEIARLLRKLREEQPEISTIA